MVLTLLNKGGIFAQKNYWVVILNGRTNDQIMPRRGEEFHK